MQKTLFKIEKMDCPSEEGIIRLKLQSLDFIAKLDFDLQGRMLTVFHTGDAKRIETALVELKLGSALIENTEIENNIRLEDDKQQYSILWAVLLINFSFFVLEMTTGLISKSMGLVADSLDMLADSLVYGLSLLAVGATVVRKKRVALFSGYFQLTLAAIGFSEVIRRFIGTEAMPDFRVMIVISLLALAANTISLWLLQKSKNKEAHIQASIIFSSNDIIINMGVIMSGLLVWWLHSGIPDLIIGSIVFVIVIRGAMRILKLAK